MRINLSFTIYKKKPISIVNMTSIEDLNMNDEMGDWVFAIFPEVEEDYDDDDDNASCSSSNSSSSSTCPSDAGTSSTDASHMDHNPPDAQAAPGVHLMASRLAWDLLVAEHYSAQAQLMNDLLYSLDRERDLWMSFPVASPGRVGPRFDRDEMVRELDATMQAVRELRDWPSRLGSYRPDSLPAAEAPGQLETFADTNTPTSSHNSAQI